MRGDGNGREGTTRSLTALNQHAIFDTAGDDQRAIFGVPDSHEQAILAEALEYGSLKPENKGLSPRSMFGTPGWYSTKCEALSKAIWAEQLTELEATSELRFQHAVLMFEMKHRRLWRKPRKGTGRRRPLRLRFRGWTCSACRGPVGAYTGVCGACHFGGWWWP